MTAGRSMRPSEEAFLADASAIDVIVSKNSGGTATYPKIAAARRLRLPVVMIDRPHKPHGVALDSPEAAMHWLEAQLAHRASLLAPRRIDPGLFVIARDQPRRRGSDQHQRAHIGLRGSTSPSVVVIRRTSPEPAARTMTTTVDGDLCRRRISKASPS